jgi:hypothetical protein
MSETPGTSILDLIKNNSDSPTLKFYNDVLLGIKNISSLLSNRTNSDTFLSHTEHNVVDETKIGLSANKNIPQTSIIPSTSIGDLFSKTQIKLEDDIKDVQHQIKALDSKEVKSEPAQNKTLINVLNKISDFLNDFKKTKDSTLPVNAASVATGNISPGEASFIHQKSKIEQDEDDINDNVKNIYRLLLKHFAGDVKKETEPKNETPGGSSLLGALLSGLIDWFTNGGTSGSKSEPKPKEGEPKEGEPKPGTPEPKPSEPITPGTSEPTPEPGTPEPAPAPKPSEPITPAPAPEPITPGTPVPGPTTPGAPAPAPEPIIPGTPAPAPITPGTPVPEPITPGTPVPEPITPGTPVPEPTTPGTPAPAPEPIIPKGASGETLSGLGKFLKFIKGTGKIATPLAIATEGLSEGIDAVGESSTVETKKQSGIYNEEEAKKKKSDAWGKHAGRATAHVLTGLAGSTIGATAAGAAVAPLTVPMAGTVVGAIPAAAIELGAMLVGGVAGWSGGNWLSDKTGATKSVENIGEVVAEDITGTYEVTPMPEGASREDWNKLPKDKQIEFDKKYGKIENPEPTVLAKINSEVHQAAVEAASKPKDKQPETSKEVKPSTENKQIETPKGINSDNWKNLTPEQQKQITTDLQAAPLGQASALITAQQRVKALSTENRLNATKQTEGTIKESKSVEPVVPTITVKKGPNDPRPSDVQPIVPTPLSSKGVDMNDNKLGDIHRSTSDIHESMRHGFNTVVQALYEIANNGGTQHDMNTSENMPMPSININPSVMPPPEASDIASNFTSSVTQARNNYMDAYLNS